MPYVTGSYTGVKMYHVMQLIIQYSIYYSILTRLSQTWGIPCIMCGYGNIRKKCNFGTGDISDLLRVGRVDHKVIIKIEA